MKKIIILFALFLYIGCLKAVRSTFDSPKGVSALGFIGDFITNSTTSTTNTSTTTSATPTIGGTIKGFTSGTLILQLNNEPEVSFTPDAKFIITTKLAIGTAYTILIKSNPSGLICSITNATGTVSSADITNVDITCSLFEKQNVFSSYWNQYYINDGTDYLTSTSTFCNVGTAKFYSGCIHAGEVRKVDIPNETSCTPFTGSDLLGAFNWNCKASTNKITFYSTRLKSGKYLSDLLDWTTSPPTWKYNQIIIKKSNLPFLQTPSSQWLTNSILHNNTGASLTASGTIYTFDTWSPSNNFSLDNPNIGFVVKPGVMIKNLSGGGTDIIVSDSFTWIEGFIDATAHGVGISISNSATFSVLKNVKIQNLSGTELILIAGKNNLLEDVRVSNNSGGNGITISGGYNTLLNTVSSNNGSATNHYGLSITGDNTLIIGALSMSNAGDGINIAGVQNKLFNFTSVNNGFNGLTSSDINLFAENLLMVNNLYYGLSSASNSASGIFLNAITAFNGSYAVNYPFSTASGIVQYHKIFKIGTSDTCALSGPPANSGLIGPTCLPGGSSTISSPQTISLSNTFSGNNGKALTDTTNSSFSSGTKAYTSIVDWINFDKFFKGIGKDSTAPFPSSALSGRCATGGTCQLYDLTLMSSDTVAKGVNVCPTVIETISTTTFLANSIEILGDGIGNDNGLCEANESCLFTPNIGAYQGHGNIVSSSSISGGCPDITAQGIKLYQYEFNGY